MWNDMCGYVYVCTCSHHSSVVLQHPVHRVQMVWRPDHDMDKRNWLLDESSRFRNVYWYRLVAYESRPALTRINFLGWSMLIDNSASSINVWSVIDPTFRFRLIFITWQWIPRLLKAEHPIERFRFTRNDFKSVIKISDRRSMVKQSRL